MILKTVVPSTRIVVASDSYNSINHIVKGVAVMNYKPLQWPLIFHTAQLKRKYLIGDSV